MSQGIKKEKLNQLQFLRFLAFMLVFLRHAEKWVHFPTPKGNSVNAITFFFMLSGFVGAYSLEGRVKSCELKDIFIFMKKKILKIYPLYLISTLAYIGVMYLSAVLFGGEAVPAGELIPQLIKNLFLLQSWWPEGYFLINGVSWFLSTLMFLYLFTQPACSIMEKISKMRSGKLVMFLMIVLLTGLLAVYNYTLHGINDEFWLYIFPPARLGEYFIGIVMGYLILSIKKDAICHDTKNEDSKNSISGNGILSIIFTILETAALLLWVFIMVIPAEGWHYRVMEWVIPNVILIGIFACGRGYLSKLFSKKPFAFLGDVSFECFLLHVIIIRLIDMGIRYLPGISTEGISGNNIIDTFIMFISLAAVIFVSWLVKEIGDKNGTFRRRRTGRD
ncbi:MAG: acyltransferase [Eubacterium sp.]|nr:acyltransferase [Eubacterium sp.]